MVAVATSNSHADESEQCATDAEAAMDLREAGKLRDATKRLEACARDACPKVVREDCRTALADLRTHAPHVTVRTRDPLGRDLPDARVTIDGAPVDLDARVHGLLVDPGTHAVRATYDGYVERELTVVVIAADVARTVELTLEPRPSSAPPTRDRTAAIVVGSLGVAGLATFGALGTWTYLDYRHSSSGCAPGCAPADVDGLRTRAHVADVALAVGIVALASATILWITAPTHAAGAPGNMAVLSW